jgi:6-phosphogluconolactonase (cycloisomerase 2 family)
MSKQLVIARPGHIYLAAYNEEGSSFTLTYDLQFAGVPSWLAFDSETSLLYAVDEDSSTFHRFRFDPSSTAPFTEHETLSTASPGLVYLDFNKTKTRLAGASFSNSTMDIFNVASGKFEKLDKPIVSASKTGPITHIQDAPHPHQILCDPTDRFFLVNDLGTDEILLIDSKDDTFSIVNRVLVEPAGSGPRHGAFYPAGSDRATHYIMLCELSNTVVTYALTYTADNIQFTQTSSISTFGPKGPPTNTARAGHFELLPDNKHVYVSNRLTGQESDSLAHFRVTQDTENHPILEFVSEVPTKGILPRMFCVLNKGKGDIVATNEKSDYGVLVFGRDSETGALETQPRLKVPMTEFMNDEEKTRYPSNGPKFVMQV